MAMEERDEPDDEVPERNASILMVDDNPANLLALEGVLGPLGHRLVKARSGSEALRLLLHEEFAVILMDVMMPEIDGFQTVALIKQRPKNLSVPIIFVTAIATEAEQISRGYEYGAVDYITKPFDPDILRAKVSVLVTLHLQAQRIVRQQALLQERRRELQRKEAQRQIAESASRMKDQFLAVVSHELKQPLNVIEGWTDLILSGQIGEAQLREALETIQRNVSLQQRLVDDLLDVSRAITGTLRLHRSRVGIRGLVRNALEGARQEAERRGLTLQVELAPDCGEIEVDPSRIEQVLSNLLANAFRFTPRGGAVTVRLIRRGGDARIEVSDTGIGIDREDLPHVFERFWQAQRGPGEPSYSQGLGLGLAIVKQLVELHGGRVDVDSPGKGKGATLSVMLPLAEEVTLVPAL